MNPREITTYVTEIKRPRRWHILVFLLPALVVYTAVMILPLFETLRQSFYNTVDGQLTFVAWAISRFCSATLAGRRISGTRSRTISSSS